MRKRTLLKQMLLLCALIVGNGSAWAQTEVTTTFNSGIASTPYTGENLDLWDISKTGTTNYEATRGIQFQGSATGTFETKASYREISSVVVEVAKSKSGAGTVKIYINDTEKKSISSFNTTKTAETLTLSPSISGKVKVVVSATANSLYIKSIKIVYNPAVAITAISLDNTSAAISIGGSFTLTPTLTPSNATETVVWESSDNDIATVSNGVVTGVAAGNCTITAKSPTDDNIKATCAITVKSATDPIAEVSTSSLVFGDVEIGQSKALTFTVTPANLTGDLSITSNNAKYTVSPTSIDQAVTTEQTITVTANPTALTDDMDGTITISGGGITSQTVALSATPYQVANVTLSATNGSIKEDDGAVKTSLTSCVGSSVTLTAVPDDGYIFDSWTATGATPAASTEAETEFTFTEATATITANFVADPKLYTTLDGTDMSSMSNAGTGYNTLKSVKKDGLTWETTGYQTSTIKNMIQLNSYNIKLPVFSGNIQSITFNVSSANGTEKDDTSNKTDKNLKFQATSDGAALVTSSNGSTNEITLDLTSLGSDYSTGYITASGAIRIWEITVAYIPTDFAVSVGDVKYATFSDHLSRDFSGTGITPYTAKVDEDKVVLTKVADGIVPANTGVILYSENVVVNEDIPFTTTDATASYFTGNELVGVNADTAVGYSDSGKCNYILQKSGSSIVFNKATNAKLRAHRAYLSTDYDVTAVGAPALEVIIGGENSDDNATAINEKVTENSCEASAPIYNLNGQRVSQPTKGLYIVNGKKVILK